MRLTVATGTLTRTPSSLPLTDLDLTAIAGSAYAPTVTVALPRIGPGIRVCDAARGAGLGESSVDLSGAERPRGPGPRRGGPGRAEAASESRVSHIISRPSPLRLPPGPTARRCGYAGGDRIRKPTVRRAGGPGPNTGPAAAGPAAACSVRGPGGGVGDPIRVVAR